MTAFAFSHRTSSRTLNPRLPLLIIAIFAVALAAYVGRGVIDSPSSTWTPALIPPFEMTMAYQTDIAADGSFTDQGTRKFSYVDERNWITWNYPPADSNGYLTTSELRDNVYYIGATQDVGPRPDGSRFIPTGWFVDKEAWHQRFDTAAARASGAGVSLEVRHEGNNEVYRVIYAKGYGGDSGQPLYEEYVYIPELPVPVEVRWLGPDDRVYALLRATSLVVDGVTIR